MSKQLYVIWIRQLVFEVEKEDGIIEKMRELLEKEERDGFLLSFVLWKKLMWGAGNERKLKRKGGKSVAQVFLWSKLEGPVVGFKARYKDWPWNSRSFKAGKRKTVLCLEI